MMGLSYLKFFSIDDERFLISFLLKNMNNFKILSEILHALKLVVAFNISFGTNWLVIINVHGSTLFLSVPV
jgi:hypothetical protein